jgi:antitoxin component of MazEF toxin-antitoxin module
MSLWEPIVARVTVQIIKAWIELFNKNRVLTSVITVISVLAFAILLVSLIISGKKAEEARRLANATYDKQIELLNNTEINLKNLTEFVEIEKDRLKQSEKLLNELKNEEALLKPVVESDRKTVESLLQLQNQKAQENLSTERWYGFGLGILASLIASILLASARFIANYRKTKTR